MHPFSLRRPTSVPEAVEGLAEGGVPYCGGTELVAVLRLGLVQPDLLVDLKRVEELAGITEDEGDVIIGARVTHDEAESALPVRRYGAVLATAASRLGNARVRASGTLAGNICFAEPRSDTLTALLALEARVELRGPDGSRTLSVDEFVEGAFSTVREEQELLVTIRLPKRSSRSSYVRFQPGEYPTVTVAAVEETSGATRLVVGAVGERPEVFRYDALDQVDAAELSERVDVIEDLNGAEDYKRHLTAVFVRRALEGLEGTRS